MRKLFIVLAIMLMIPTTNVLAYKTYTPGEEANFYLNDEDRDGYTTIVLEDYGSDDQYVKVWVPGFITSTSDVYKDPNFPDITADTFANSGIYKETMSSIDQFGGMTHTRPISEPGNIDLITLDDLIRTFEASTNDGGETYSIDVQKYGNVFEIIQMPIDASGVPYSGIYTSTLAGDGESIWVIEVEKNGDLTVSSITIKKVDANTNRYVAIPVVYADKEYDCKYQEDTQEEYTCYKCSEDDYRWSVLGSLDGTCELVADKTKSTCVKNPKTGQREDALVFIALACVTAVSLMVIKRKDLFREI